MQGVQPALLQQNSELSRILIVKMNPINCQTDEEHGNKIKQNIYEHLRSVLIAKDWVIHGRNMVIASKKADEGDNALETSVNQLLIELTNWINNEYPNMKHSGLQWVVLSPIFPNNFDNIQNLNNLFSD